MKFARVIRQNKQREREVIMARSKRRDTRGSTPRRYSGTHYRQWQSRDEQARQRRSKIIGRGAAFGIGVLLVLGFVLLVTVGHGSGTVGASGGPVSSVPTGYGSQNHAKGPCGNAGQAACPVVGEGWFAVSGASPASVAEAIANSPDYKAMQGHYGYVTTDTPALVHAFGAHTGNDYYDDDHWVVTVRNAAGMRCGIFDFVYDRLHGWMRFSSFGIISSQDPHTEQAFPYISAATAIAQLQRQRGLSLLTGTQPALIFFPIDPSFPDLNSPVHSWSGGGNSAMNPMWHIVGSDGHDYFVGADLKVYVTTKLPIAKGQP